MHTTLVDSSYVTTTISTPAPFTAVCRLLLVATPRVVLAYYS